MPEMTVTVIAASLIGLMLGGLAKGVVGVGLPMVAIPFLSTFMPIPDVVAVIYFPILVTNLWQACAGGYFQIALKRFWPMLLVLALTVGLGAFTLVRLDHSLLAALLGFTVAAFAIVSLASPHLRIPRHWERPCGILAGASGGFFGGLALISGPPVIMYFVALHLKKEEFIGSIGLVYLLTLIPAGIYFILFGVLETRHVAPGLASLVPVLAGLFLGQWIRGKINQDLFRKILLGTMVVIGLNLLRQGLL